MNATKSECRSLSRVIWAGAVVLLAATLRGVAATYTVVDLGAPGGDAVAVNNSGQIAGWTYNTTYSENFAAFWTNCYSPPVNLAAVSGNTSEANAINNGGQIVGWEMLGENQGYEDEGAYWAKSGSTASQLFSYYEGEAYAINNSGQIAGFAYTSSLQGHAAFWYSSSETPFQDLGTLGGKMSVAYGLNNSGQIVGFADVSSGAQHAAFWNSYSSSAADLGTLGYSDSQANAINSAGQIVGWVGTIAIVTSPNAAYWQNGSSTPVQLETLGGNTSQADAINTSGQIVGYSETPGGAEDAVLWNNSSSAPLDLNTVIPANSGWVLYEATAINDSGEIVGRGKNPAGNSDAFALVPLPVLHIVPQKLQMLYIWWQDPSGAFTLQTNSNLTIGPWGGYNGAITSNNGTNSITITSPSGNSFFRLIDP